MGLLALAACGGSAITGNPDDGGSAGSGGSATGGTSGSGGSSGSGGAAGTGATGGTGGSGGVGGVGGMAGTAGTSGSSGSGGAAGIGGTAGSGGTGPVCPPVPSCNWCGGTELFDAQGCVVGYQCANGADPCNTQPCKFDPSVCAPDEDCLPDDLCWPTGCQGTCSGTFPEPCSCKWSCNDGNEYSAVCDPGSAGYGCACSVNGFETDYCYTPSGGFACETPMCCGFPH